MSIEHSTMFSFTVRLRRIGCCSTMWPVGPLGEWAERSDSYRCCIRRLKMAESNPNAGASVLGIVAAVALMFMFAAAVGTIQSVFGGFVMSVVAGYAAVALPIRFIQGASPEVIGYGAITVLVMQFVLMVLPQTGLASRDTMAYACIAIGANYARAIASKGTATP